jgi:DNA invertase Pin-like site-specific DNA recombinase
MTRLPASLDELRGRRAARWIRESTRGQADHFGPEAQREQQDRAIDRHELVDTAIEYFVAHSGRTVATTPEWAAMLAAAGDAYDVLVVGYVSRFARDLRTAVNARHDLHQAGAVLLFADDRILSSDEHAWDAWAREAVEAESYSRRLSRRVREGFAAKRRRDRDPGSGETSYGFRRVARLVEPDPATMPTAIEAYRLSAAGASDQAIADELGIGLWRIRTILRSSLYAGRLPDGTETRFPAPVPLELVEAAAAARARRTWSGHHPHDRVYPLTDRGPLVCDACDRPIKGAFRTERAVRMHRHPDKCPAWTIGEARAGDHEDQVARILARAAPNRQTQARIRAALARPAITPDRLAIARIDAELRRVALELAGNTSWNKSTAESVIDRLEQLRAQRAELEASPIAPDQPDAERALDYLADLGKLWRRTDDEGRRALAVATFARLGAIGDRIVSIEVTPAAERRGLVLALPTSVTAVGGTGEGPIAVTWPLRIAHRSAWLRASRTA